MLKAAPNPVDVQDLQFKLRCRLKVFDNTERTNFPQPCNLVACASRFGLIFVGTNTSQFQVIQLKHFEEFTKSDGDSADYQRRNIPLVSPPKFLSVNCEHTVLCIVIEKNSCPCALFYDVKSFWQKQIVQLTEIRLSPTPGVYVTDVNWNPALGAIFTACKSDGTLGVYELKGSSVDINELPAAAGATCFCWSPKGKQIAVGSRDGKITQYKPDLKAVKVINAPPLKEPHSLISMQWVSNYQFIGIFQSIGSNGQSSLIVVDAPKTGDSVYINYDDICYSNGNTRPVQFYTILQQNWNVLMVASSNSMEVGVLGYSNDSWFQWIMGDAARAELPLSTDRQDTLPVGFGLDIGCMQQLQWGESTLPPCPVLLILSHYGMLCCFNVINLKEGVPTVCSPPEPVKDASGLQYFVSKTEVAKPSVPPNKQNVPNQQNVLNQQPTIQIPKTPQSRTSTPVYEIQTNTASNKPPEVKFSTTQPSIMFGGQAILTPITQASRSNTTLPQSSGSILTSSYSPLPVDNKIVTTPTQKVTPTPVSKPSLLSNIGLSKITQPKSKEELSISVDLKTDEEAEAVFAQMVKEECVFLESELKVILLQGKTLKLNLGTEEDKTKIVESTKSIQDFCKELLDICTTQNSEVHILKQNLLQSWAWYEEVKSRYAASKDESLMIFSRAQPLDSASEKQLEDIRHLNYYLESQIAQAHRALDEQWENFQDYCKKTYKMQIPTMEIIFQTMVKQNAILRKQQYILKDIGSRIKSKSRSALGSSLLISVDGAKDLPEELKRLRMTPDDIRQLQYEHIVNRTKSFTKKKSDTLRSFLKGREYPHVSAIKPQLSTSIIQASPSTKIKSLNLLNTKTSPVVKENVTKKLEFVQSTPLPTINKPESLTVDNQPTTPIEGLQNFTMKFEAKNFVQKSEPSFAPLSKSAIASSPNSAFVATSFGTAVSTSISTSSSFKPVIFGTTTTTATTVSVAKPQTNFVITSSSSSGTLVFNPSINFSKPYSFTGSVFQDVGNTNAPKPTATLFVSPTTTMAVNTTAKPSFSFVPNTVSKVTTPSSLAFTKADVKNVTAKSTSVDVATPKQTPPPTAASIGTSVTKSVTTTTSSLNLNITTNKTTAVTTTSIFGSIISTTTTSPPTFSISANVQNIFGVSSEKSESPAITKPFIFTSVTTTKPAFIPSTTPNRVAVSVTTTQSSSFISSPSSDTSKTVTFSQPLVSFSTPSTTAASKAPSITSTITVPSIFSSNQFSAKPGIFTAPTTTVQSSIFNAPASTVSSQPTIFATPVTKSSIFGTTTTSVAASTVASTTTVTAATSSITTTVSVVSTTSTTTTVASTSTVAPPASTNIVVTTTASSQQSVFGSVSSATSSLQSPQTTVFTGFAFGGSTPSTKPIIFGSGDLNTTKPSIFGTPTTSAPISVFGTATPSTTQPSTPVFATTAASTVSQPSTVFGNVTPSTTSQSQVFNVFGDSSQKSSIFGCTASTSTTQSGSIFGGVGSTNTTQSGPLFGSTPSTASIQAGSIFGNAVSTNSTQPSIFGSSIQSTSVFGPTTTSSSFGQNQSIFDAPKTSQSVFGQSSVFGSSGSVFGNTNVFGSTPFAPSGGLFGNVTSTTSANIFGATTTAASTVFGSNTSVFGAPVSTTSSVFGSGNVFSTTTQSTPFAASTSAGSFGFGGLNVGSAPSTSSSGFGASQTANPFGGGAKNVFGASSNTPTSSVFGSTSGPIFGSSTQSFGGTTFGSQSPPFGQQSTFGQSAFGSGTFAQQSSGPFSAGGSGSVAQSGFGGGSTFQKPAGFGSSPVFGSSPAFGSAPSFGGAPAFGSPPTFGSPPKIFGSGSTSFGATTGTQNASFGNLANQPTVGFGNLAQQASNTPTQSTPFSGSSSFSSWR